MDDDELRRRQKPLQTSIVKEVAKTAIGVAEQFVPFGPVLDGYRNRRLRRWWERLLAAVPDRDAFVEGLRHPGKAFDEDDKIAAIMAAARASTDAFDEVVIDSIALLLARFLGDPTMSRVGYRDLLAMLTGFDASEYVAFRAAIHELNRLERVKGGAGQPGGDHFITRLMKTGESWEWAANQDGRRHGLAVGPDLERIVDVFDRLGRRFADVDGTNSAANVWTIKIPWAVVERLASLMPLQ